MTKENQEKSLIQVIQQIYITWSNGAKGIFTGPAVLTPEEMSDLSLTRPRIISVKVGKPMILSQNKENQNVPKNDKVQEKKDSKGS